MFRVILYCLKSDTNGKPILSYDLNADEIVISNTVDQITLRLNGKVVTLFKQRWMNKIYDDGKTFFYMAGKNIDTKYIFGELMKYSISKLNTRIEFLTTLKNNYQKEVSQLKLKAA